MTTTVCPHCEDTVRNNSWRRHQQTCIANPAVIDHMRTILADYCHDGILTEGIYRTVGRINGWMVYQTIVRRMPWERFVKTLGFQPYFSPEGSHIARYARSEEFRAELHHLAQLLHDGRCGPSASEWDQYKPDGGHLAISLVGHHHRRWGHLLDWAGLEQGSSGYYARAAKIRRLDLGDIDAPPDPTAERERWQVDCPIEFIQRERRYYWWQMGVYVCGVGLEFR